MVNVDFDGVAYGITVASEVAAATLSLANVEMQGEFNDVRGYGETGILCMGSNVKILGSNVGVTNFKNNAIRLGGPGSIGNYAQFSNVRIVNWNYTGVGFPALEAPPGNTVETSGWPLTAGGNTGPTFGGGGRAGVSSLLPPPP